MSSQILELLIFAGIAFFIINKLLSYLGSTSDQDPTKHSFFGETSSVYKIKNVNNLFENSFDENFLLEENKENLKEGLSLIQKKMPSFQVEKFIKGAKVAFEVIIEASNDDDIEELSPLVDSRYIEDFHKHSQHYGEFIQNNDLVCKISETYNFANHMFIKVLFIGENVTTKIKNFNEEWTFTRSILSKDINWLLSNVESNNIST